jgi:hypothetical protein
VESFITLAGDWDCGAGLKAGTDESAASLAEVVSGIGFGLKGFSMGPALGEFDCESPYSVGAAPKTATSSSRHTKIGTNQFNAQ